MNKFRNAQEKKNKQEKSRCNAKLGIRFAHEGKACQRRYFEMKSRVGSTTKYMPKKRVEGLSLFFTSAKNGLEITGGHHLQAPA